MSEGFDWAALLNKAKAASFDPIPNGNYHVSVHEAEAVIASTGRPMIKLKLNVEDGQHTNRKLWHQLVLSTDNEIALAMFFNNLKCFSIGPDFLSKCPPGSLAPIAQALIGKHATAEVGQKEWQGKPRNEVKGYIALGAGAAGAPAGGGLPGLPTAAPSTLPGLSTGPVVQPSVSSASPSDSGPANGLPGLSSGTEPTQVEKDLQNKGPLKLTQNTENPF